MSDPYMKHSVSYLKSLACLCGVAASLGLSMAALPSYAQGVEPPLPDLLAVEDDAVLAPDEAFSLDTADLFDFEKTPEERQSEARKEAFDQALDMLMPLRPDEIRRLLEHVDRRAESIAVPIYPNPKPEVAVQTLSLDPGSKPAVIKVAHGSVTTLNIVDMSGAPWPIEDLSWAGDFEIIEASAEPGTHILRISPSTEFAHGNMSMRLLDLNTPVILMMETSRDIVHYRFDAIIPKYGPLGKAPLINKGLSITAGGEDISAVLEGVPSSGAKRMVVSGVDGRTSAYSKGSKIYVRTPLTLLSPGWSSSVTSADGMNVYEIDSAPVLILSENGQMVRARLSEKEDLFDD